MGFSFKQNLPNIITVSVVILGALVLSSMINPIFNTTMKTLTKTVYINQKEGMKSKNNTKPAKQNNKKNNTQVKKKHKPAKKKKVIGGKKKKNKQ